MAKYPMIVGASTLGFGLVGAIVVLIGGMAWGSINATRTARNWALHTYEVLGVIDELLLTVHEAETGQRGYLLTGNNTYLAPYTAARARVDSLQSKLRGLIADNPTEADRLLALGPVLERKFGELEQAVQIRRNSGLEAALRVVDTDVGQLYMGQIGALLGSMRAAERALLVQRTDDTVRRSEWANWMVVAATAVAILTLVWATLSLNQYATTDSLTGLLNRNRISGLLAAWKRNRRRPQAAMLCVDIDRFRSMNQVLGQAVSDALLVEIAQRLRSVAGRHWAGRIGGDDFTIFCVGITPEQADTLGVAAVAAVARPLEVQGRSLRLTASVGVAHSEATGELDLRQGADDALYVAKNRGGNQSAGFLQAVHDQRKELAELEQDLHRALESEYELSMAYQPIVRPSDRALIGMEALVRWNHPRLGPIPPDRFVPLAEARGMIVPFGLKTMEMVVRQAALWYVRYPGKCPVININFSPIQLTAGNAIADLVRLLEQHNLPTGGFCVEVTESAFTDDNAVRVLTEAKALGFKVTMDDFGVGFSALSQLPRLPVGTIKLDRSFITHATERAGDAAILAAIVQLAKALKLRVIAEGVERDDQLALVTQCGCDAIQGYYFSRPLTPAGLEVWFADTQPVVAQIATTMTGLP